MITIADCRRKVRFEFPIGNKRARREALAKINLIIKIHTAFRDALIKEIELEDVGLLPKKLFSEIAENAQSPKQFADLIGQLLTAMADGGYVFVHPISHFNGNLFVESPVLELTAAEIKHVQAAARLDWSAVDPSIFGTLVQRGLDPDTRAQLGAQYTSREDIETLIEPVVIEPLRREWRETRRAVENLLQTGKVNPTGKDRPLTKDGANKAYAIAIQGHDLNRDGVSTIGIECERRLSGGGSTLSPTARTDQFRPKAKCVPIIFRLLCKLEGEEG